MNTDVYLYVLKDGWIVNKRWLGERGTWDKMSFLYEENILRLIHEERGFDCYELRKPEELVKLIESEGNDKFGYAGAPDNFELIEILDMKGCKYEILVEY